MKLCSNQIIKRLIKVMNLSLLKDPIFMVFTLSDFATCLGYYFPYFSIVDQASDLGISSNMSSYLLSIIGIVNTCSRIIMGHICDKPWVNRLWVFNISLIICGVGKLISYKFAVSFFESILFFFQPLPCQFSVMILKHSSFILLYLHSQVVHMLLYNQSSSRIYWA